MAPKASGNAACLMVSASGAAARPVQHLRPLNDRIHAMNRSQSGPRRLSARRLALLATTIAGLGAAALFVPPNGTFQSGGIGTPAQAQDLSARAKQLPQKPVGFAD